MRRTSIFWLLLIVLILSSACPAMAQSGSIKLLAVSESPSGLTGSVAHLHLDIQPGSGRVFIDTLPAAKIDTQLSTRFAKDMACKYLNVDCSGHDFFYTIRADSPIVGGPSAGAAITVLTVSLIKGIAIDKNIVITGTINSGELIGPVGGVKEKITAAAEDSLSTVLIAKGERFAEIGGSDGDENASDDLVEYGMSIGVNVIEVSTLDDAVFHYSGQRFRQDNLELEINPMYEETMRFLSEQLCRRSSYLESIVRDHKVMDIIIIDSHFIDAKKMAENLTEEGSDAYDAGNYYSAASYCFGANVKFSSLIYTLRQLSFDEAIEEIKLIESDINALKESAGRAEIKTMTDLQAYMIVMDRISESEIYLNKSMEHLLSNLSKLPDALAFASEREKSAASWSNFIGQKGKKFRISEAELMRSCVNKITEAEEQYNYVDYLFKGLLRDTRSEIEAAKSSYQNGEYEICLYKATLAKASIGVVASTIGVRKDGLDSLLERKLDAAKRSIILQQENGIFPILGYSYYEYANSLKDKDIFSSLLYAEYALELTNIDIYFQPDKIRLSTIKSSDALIFFSGISIGIMLSLMIITLEKAFHQRGRYRAKAPSHKNIKFTFRKR